jgi:HAD superfamily hydrolase (TIGR01450 family)
MKDYRAVLLDLDGVIYRGEQVLPGARELVAWLDATGRRALYLSNNSLATPADVTAKLARLGLPRPQGRVLTAGGLAAQVLARRFPGGRVYVLAMPAIAGLVAELGLHLAWQETEAGPVPDAVLVGLDRSLTYERLARGLRAVLGGATFIAVNRDPRLPVEDGFELGTGSIATALEYASGQPAEIIGKPAPDIVVAALRQLDTSPEDALMVGDGLDLDVVAGRAAGVDTALVLTGLTTADQARAATGDRQPTYVFNDLPELLAALQRTS